LARRAARKATRQERSCRRDPLRPLALDGTYYYTLSRRRPSRNFKQRRRESDQAAEVGGEELALCGQRLRRSACRALLHAHTYGGSQRSRTRSLPARRNRAHRQPSNQPAGRIAALELAASRDAERRRLRQRSSTAKCRSLALALTIRAWMTDVLNKPSTAGRR